MKKFKVLLLTLAIGLFIAGSAFMPRHEKKQDPVYFWFLTASPHTYEGQNTAAAQATAKSLSQMPNGTAVEDGYISATPPNDPGGTPQKQLFNP